MAQQIKDSDRARQADQAKHHARHPDHENFLAKGDGINVALIVLKKGAKLQEHHTRAPITVQVIEGRINFIANGKTQLVTPGMLLALDRAIEHSIEALEESAMVLTVGGEQM